MSATPRSVELVVIGRPLHFDGREIQVGERFNATPVDAASLMRRGKAASAGDQQ